MKEKFKTECIQCHQEVYWEGDEEAEEQNRLLMCGICGVKFFDFCCESCDSIQAVVCPVDKDISCPNCSTVIPISEEQLSQIYILNPVENLSEAERYNYVPLKESLPFYVIAFVVIGGFLYFLLRHFVFK